MELIYVVVYKLPRGPIVMKDEYYIFASQLGYVTSLLRQDWALSISDGALPFDDPYDVCHYAEIYDCEIIDGPSEVMAEWVKVKKKEN